MQRSGYFFAGSKSAGLISTPSIVVPSLLFHEIASRVPSVNAFVWAVVSESFRGVNVLVPETKTSFMLAGGLATKAIASPVLLNENDPPIQSSGRDTRVTFPFAGSTRNKCEAVFCDAVK